MARIKNPAKASGRKRNRASAENNAASTSGSITNDLTDETLADNVASESVGKFLPSIQRTSLAVVQKKTPSRTGKSDLPKQRKPHRFRPGTVALREIRNFQKSTKLLIPAGPFIRIVREISFKISKNVPRWKAEALVALQEAAEDFLVQLFEEALLCALHGNRVTLLKKDLELARRLGKKGQPN